MTNSTRPADSLSRLCSGRWGRCTRRGGRYHGATSGRAAREAAVYPTQLCRAILRGCRAQFLDDGVVVPGSVGLQPHRRLAGKMVAVFEDDGAEPESSEGEGSGSDREEEGMLARAGFPNPIFSVKSGERGHRDDITGQILDPLLLRGARQK